MPKTYKLIEPWQANYIRANHISKTAPEMAKALSVDEVKVRVFCQAEYLEPKSTRKTDRRRKY